jgi:hypothetical protein
MAHPMAEQMATISANSGVKCRLDSLASSDKPTSGDIANVTERCSGLLEPRKLDACGDAMVCLKIARHRQEIVVGGDHG